MATVLRFPLPPSGDWSPSERARLNELAARFAEQADVEVVFGRSDRGDPWCVVLDAQDEVLVHVAREGSGFVAHAATADVFVRSADLRTAVERVLGSRWLEERSDVVVPFASGSRAVQMLSAVLIVGSFVEHHRAEAEPADEWVFAAARPLKPGARDSQRDDAAKVAVAADATPASGHQPGGPSAADDAGGLAAIPLAAGPDPLVSPDVPSEAPVEAGRELAARLIAASAESDRTPTADILVGTPGDDHLDGGGAPPGRHDLLDAGAGNDRLLLDSGAIAIGGEGADQFLVRAPGTAANLPLLGVIVDFDPAVDRLLPEGSATLTILASLPTRDIFADPNVNLAPVPALPGARLVIDLDGDGLGDGYLLVNSVDPGAERLQAIRQVLSELDAPPPPSIAEPGVSAPPPAAPAVEPDSEPASGPSPEPAAPAPRAEPEATAAEPLPGSEATESSPAIESEPSSSPATTDRSEAHSALAATVAPELEAEAPRSPSVEPEGDAAGAWAPIIDSAADTPLSPVAIVGPADQSNMPALTIEVI